MSRPSPPLSLSQLGLLAEATLDNSRRLLNEAKALGLLGHYARAFSLAVLAAEEFGKHLMCFGAVGLRTDDEEMWRDFHTRFRSHTPKYENLFAMAGSVIPPEDRERVMAELARHVRADQHRKLAGFYVDLAPDGNAIHPDEVIGPGVVSNAITVYDQVISMWESIYGGADFTAVFEEGMERGAEELRYALIEGDEATIRRFFADASAAEEEQEALWNDRSKVETHRVTLGVAGGGRGGVLAGWEGMKLCYVDETGTDGQSPLVVFVGVIADVARVHRTRREFEELFRSLAEIPDKTIAELKGSNIYYGNDRWRGVDGEVRHAAIGQLCEWLADRKHFLALVALDVDAYDDSDLAGLTGLDIWMSGALHIALQIQKEHQGMKRKKGATFLVFDEHKVKGDALAELLFDPPSWTDDYYNRGKKQLALDQITDTAFYARSHHVGLVQVADVFAFILRRYSEICDYEQAEGYEGELNRLSGWMKILEGRLLKPSHRWPKRTKSELAKAYVALCPPSLRKLG